MGPAYNMLPRLISFPYSIPFFWHLSHFRNCYALILIKSKLTYSLIATHIH